jgi:hypothetical protein
MPDAQELQSVLDAAERAASTGDYAAAERLLRDAASQQESTLGSRHPDLANTFNNLGIVCELTEKPDDAEAFFRKSYAIATASLEPDHPFVATSRKNLEDFCAARGRPVDLPVPQQAVGKEPEPAPAIIVRPAEPQPVSVRHSSPVAVAPPVSRQRLLAVGVGVLIGIVLLFAWLRERGSAPDGPGSAVTESAPTPASAQPRAAPPPPPAQAAPSSAARAASRPVSAPPSPPRTPRPIRSAAPSPDVVTAQLCTALSTAASWHCAGAGQTVAPGTLYFYTRLKSPTATTVQHRWYRDDRLRQSVELSVSPNTKDGYRTYSKTTVSGAGQWRVELRSRDGVVLQEQRFSVR